MPAPADDPVFIRPRWPAPPGVAAAVTTRAGGASRPPFDGFNLADHVGDDPAAVAANRARLRAALDLPGEPAWLRQVHGCGVAVLTAAPAATPEADAAVTAAPGVVCAVLTADCLPVLLCSRDGGRVGAVHAGWRGLAAGVLEAAVAALGVPPADVLAWLGPAIGPSAFQVGPEVRAAFVETDPGAEEAFVPDGGDRWRADLQALARRRLAACGVEQVFGGGPCTHGDPARFYSYRRDGVTGRMAALIWRKGAGGWRLGTGTEPG